MLEYAPFFHYLALAITLVLCGTGVAIGQGRISSAALWATYIQPQSQSLISRASILSMALTETAAILALVITIMLFFNTSILSAYGPYMAIAQSGVIFAIGCAGLAISLVSALPASKAILSIARQPFFAEKILNIMLITMSITQTPLIFGFIVVLLIHLQLGSLTTLEDSVRFFAAAFCIGFGSVGPAIGQGIFAQAACQAVGMNRDSYKRILPFSLLSQSIIETPILFALLASLLMFGVSNPSSLKAIALVMAGVCIGLCNMASGISSGITSASACRQIGLKNTPAALISRTSLLAQGLIDTFAIYGLIVGILLIFYPS
jgi:F-type H+-transporting ATPase subunit c